MKTSSDAKTRPTPATATQSAALLGSIAISRLRVYEGLAPDGWAGGSPHLHLASAEAYVVLAGRGSVELLSLSNGYQHLELRPGDALQFDPGVVHRIVNEAELEILVLMQNAGLPEKGDAVFTFPPDTLEDVEAYAQHAAIESVEDALERRDLAVAGMSLLKEGFARSSADGEHLLRALHRRAAELVSPSAASWLQIIDRGSGAAVEETRGRIEKLVAGQPSDLASAQVSRVVMTPERLGMCGLLNRFAIEGTPT